MEYKFSDRVLTLKPSAIREIFKYAADPSYVSLSAGNPAPEAFPSKQLAAISAKLMEEEPILALQYSTTEGYPPLLQHLKAYMKSSKTSAPRMTAYSSQAAHSKSWICSQNPS